MKRPGAVSIACTFGIGLLALAPAPLYSPAHAQSADLVLCDRIAADPADPDKPADVKGVADIAPADVATAIKFCKVASAASRRALYQLGRAYAANRQLPEAVGASARRPTRAATSAMVELGVLYATGNGVAEGRSAGAQAVRARRRGRQSARRRQSRRAVRSPASRRRIPLKARACWRRRRRPIRRSAVSARHDDC